MKANQLITEGYNNAITVIFIGVGGTGSLLLHMLARIAVSLQEIRGIRLEVAVMDGDMVDNTNIGRQCYAPYDVGRNKAVVVTERINRFYGLQWNSYANHFPFTESRCISNVVISCVDTVQARKKIEKHLQDEKDKNTNNHGLRFAYWLDCGNNFDNGNVVLTDMSRMPLISSYLSTVKPGRKKATCSLALSVGSQHLAVNSWAANIAYTMLWDMLYYHKINIHAAFYNIETMQVRTIKTSKYEHGPVQTSTVDAV